MHLVYFGRMPGQGTGSPIIIHRHLERFVAAGHRVSIVGGCDQPPADGWPVLRLPDRRFGWPPPGTGDGRLKSLRLRLWAGECRRMLNAPPDAVLTYISYQSALYSEIAARYARLVRRPLTTILHDDFSAFPPDTPEPSEPMLRRYRWIMKQAHHRWFVTRELAQAFGYDGDADELLLPIPAGSGTAVTWRDEFARAPHVAYAGHLYEQQFPLLGRLARAIHRAGGRLLLLSRATPALRDFAGREPVELHSLLATNREALEFVGARAAGFLAAQCDRLEEMPWVRSSFPSKIAEFSHLGLPMLFVSPAGSAIHRWNAGRDVPFNLLPHDDSAVEGFVTALKRPESWQRLAQSTQELARTEFDPAQIHDRLLRHLGSPDQ